MIKAKKIQVQMLYQRGYTIPDSEHNITSKSKLNRIYKFNDIDTLYVHYCLEETLSDSLKIFIKKMEPLENGILIGNDDQIKNFTKKTYKDYFDKLTLKNVQLFTLDELSFNITESIYSPTYEKIDKSFIIPSIANANQLPKLLLNDPIVKFYDFRPGDVIRTTETIYIDTINTTNINYCIVTSTTYH